MFAKQFWSPDICDLMYVRQQSQETVHQFWARFLLVKDKIKDCRDEDAIYSAIIVRMKESSMPSTTIAYYTSLTWQP